MFCAVKKTLMPNIRRKGDISASVKKQWLTENNE